MFYCSDCTAIVAGCITGVIVGMTDRRHSFMLTNITNNVTVRWIGVACCRDFCIGCVVTTCTCLICIPSNFGTCRSLGFVVNCVMAKSRNYVCNICISAVACIGYVSFFYTRGICYHCTMTMTCWFNYFGFGRATNTVSKLKTIFSACGKFYLYPIAIGMFCEWDFFIRCVVTAWAGFICVPAHFGASRCFCFVIDYVMTKCICFVCNICVTTVTGIGRISFFCASRLGDSRHMVVACCRDFNVGCVVTTWTCLVCFPANFCAGRCLGIVVYNVMVKSINGLCFSRKFSITNWAIHYTVVTAGRCARCSNNAFLHCLVACVTCWRDNDGFSNDLSCCICILLVASSTVPIFNRAILCAGGINLLMMNKTTLVGAIKNVNSCVFISLYMTNRAFLML